MVWPAGPSSRSTLSLAPTLEQAADDHGEHEGVLGAGLVVEQAGEAEEGADGAVMAGGAGADGSGLGGGGQLILEGEAAEVDGVLEESGEVGKGAFLDFAVMPVGFAEEVAGGAEGEGGGDMHCMTRKARGDRKVTSYKII